MLIEGIDDSVLLVFLVFPIVTYIFYVLIKNNFISQHQQVHPDSQNHVNETRELLNSQSRTRRRELSLQETSIIHCPICLEQGSYVIETNCGHKFCSNCIIRYWQTSTGIRLLRQMSCPYCRQSIICLLPLFTEQEINSRDSYCQTIDSINEYNRRFSGAPRSLMDYLHDLPTLFRHAMSELFSLNGLDFWYRIRVICIFLMAFMYLLSPLDIIPEALFGLFGLIDDFVILFLMAIYVTIIFRQFIANRAT